MYNEKWGRRARYEQQVKIKVARKKRGIRCKVWVGDKDQSEKSLSW